MSAHTPGPWRWELNEATKGLQLVGGVPKYDLTILDPERWGMWGATLRFRDTAHDGLNIMHKLHDRRDWIAPFPGREHHARWCLNVIHPDARLMAAAPDLLAALNAMLTHMGMDEDEWNKPTFNQARAAIAKATGEA